MAAIQLFLSSISLTKKLNFQDRHDLANELLEAVLASPATDYDEETKSSPGPMRKRMRRSCFLGGK